MMYDVTEVMRKLEENPTIAMPTDKVRQVKELWRMNLLNQLFNQD